MMTRTLHPVPRLPWPLLALDWLLVAAFFLAGPAYYFGEVARLGGLTVAGRILWLSVHLLIHFLAGWYFTTCHFLPLEEKTVRTLLTGWRVLLALWTLLLVMGYQQMRAAW